MAKELVLASGEKVIVDDDDWDKLSKFNWYFHSGGYAARNGPKIKGIRLKTIFMHHEICRVESPYIGDHINGNRLDNRKQNLRLLTTQQNNFNRSVNRNKTSSKFKGVFWSKEKNLWVAQIKLNSVTNRLGYFKSELDAAIAYNNKAIKLFGGYARLNDAPISASWWERRVFIKNNSSGFRCVTEQRQGKWQARITVDGKRISLGYFDTAVKAAEAYNSAAIKFHGERALLNQF